MNVIQLKTNDIAVLTLGPCGGNGKPLASASIVRRLNLVVLCIRAKSLRIQAASGRVAAYRQFVV